MANNTFQAVATIDILKEYYWVNVRFI
jgi:hypothetical protein